MVCTSLETAHAAVVQLVEDFAASEAHYLRYGWSAGTPLAVLTDFEQLHIFDSRARPDIATALARGRILSSDLFSPFSGSAGC